MTFRHVRWPRMLTWQIQSKENEGNDSEKKSKKRIIKI